MRIIALVALALATALVAGCANPAGGGNANTAQKTASKAQAAKTASVSGLVSAPAGVISTGGGNVISTGGGNVISTGGGNVISTGGGNFTVLAVSEKPLANTPVMLVDGAGKPVPGVAETKTDAQGKFTFAKVPQNATYQVVAKAQSESTQKEAPLRSLVKVGASNVTANLGASTTMAAALVLDKVGGNLAAVDAQIFEQLASAIGEELTPALLPDFSDPGDVLATVTELSKTLDDLKKMVEGFESAGVPAAQAGIDAAKEALEKAQQQLGEASAAADFAP